MNYKDIYEKVRAKFLYYGIKGEERFIHSLGVSEVCGKLASIYKPNDIEFFEKAKNAGLIHDYAKFLNLEEFKELLNKHNIDLELHNEYFPIYHGYVGYLLIEDELDVHDKEILNAIIYHSTGKSDMTLLEKILFVGDFIEPNRQGDFFDRIREFAYDDLDKAVYLEAKETYDYLKSKNRPIFFETINCYNYYKNIIENR